MPNPLAVFSRLVWLLNEEVGQAKFKVRERLGHRRPITILPYRGFGTPQRLYLKGRVLEEQRLRPARESDSRLVNLWNMLRRFRTNEIPHARVLARYHGEEQTATCNSEGYFEVSLACDEPVEPWIPWQDMQLDLLSPLRRGYEPVSATGAVFVPPPGATFGVVSDVDDTVIATGATSILRLLKTVLLSNARTRLPLSGVAAFYRALLRGPDGSGLNPLFYVSSSPWNVYDLLTEFFQLHDIPYGPVLFLRDWGISPDARPTRRRSHKLSAIATVLGTYSHLPFILIGDSGEEDPEIYRDAVREHKGRIMAVYLRNVDRHPARIASIRRLADEVVRAGSTLILADDTLAFACHAAERGWIPTEALDAIEAEERVEASLPDPSAPIIGERPKSPRPVVVHRGADEPLADGADALSSASWPSCPLPRR
ncbi:MAG: App1 family protein [Anaerolineae bacterium]